MRSRGRSRPTEKNDNSQRNAQATHDASSGQVMASRHCQGSPFIGGNDLSKVLRERGRGREGEREREREQSSSQDMELPFSHR